MRLSPIKKLYISLEIAIVSLICYLIGFSLSFNLHQGQSVIGGFWCMVSALTALQVGANDSVKACKEIIIGSIIGAGTACLASWILGYHYYVVVVAVTLSVFITISLDFISSVKMSSANAGIVVALGLYFPNYPPLYNAGLRVSETLIGTFISILFLYISTKIHIRPRPKK